ncbi:MAG: hypothetical protein JRJ39_16735 [Deltaproteobacteria bacterium]|nr:hypothetical protein [Deltaproteobacteria bacterium]
MQAGILLHERYPAILLCSGSVLGLAKSVQIDGIPYMITTGCIHAVYFTLLGISYQHGEISLVYPIARGSGVGLTAIFASLIFAEKFSLLGAFSLEFLKNQTVNCFVMSWHHYFCLFPC